MAHKIAHPTARTSAVPGPSELNYTPGAPGHFTGGDPVTGEPATVVTMDWLNMVQDEIQNVVEQADLDLANPNQPDNSQLVKAIPILSRWNLPIRAVVNYGNTSPQGDHDASTDRGRAIPCDAALGHIRVLLPKTTDAGNGFALAVVKTDASANTVSLIPEGTDQLQGENAPFRLVSENQSVLLTSDGLGNWRIIANTQSPPEPVDGWARANMVLNAWRIAVNGELDQQGMVDGVTDEFEDSVGIDQAKSTNANIRDGAILPRSLIVTPFEISDWTGSKVNLYQISSGRVHAPGEVGGHYAYSQVIYGANNFSGDFELDFRLPVGTPIGAPYRASFAVTDANVAQQITTNMWENPPAGVSIYGLLVTSTPGDHTIYAYKNSIVTGVAPGQDLGVVSDGEIFSIRRINGVLSVLRSGSVIHTQPSIDINDKTLLIGMAIYSGQTYTIDQISSREIGPLANIDAISDAITAEQNALTGTGFFLVEAKEAAIVNTDFMGYLSNDDGLNWQAVTLERIAEFGNQIMYRGTTQFVTTGRDMRIRFATANSKDIALHAWSHIWGD